MKAQVEILTNRQISPLMLQAAKLSLEELESLLIFLSQFQKDYQSRGGIIFGDEIASSSFLAPEGQDPVSRKKVALQKRMINSGPNKILYQELQSNISSILATAQIADSSSLGASDVVGRGNKTKISNLFSIVAKKAPLIGRELSSGIEKLVEHFDDKKFEERYAKLLNIFGNSQNIQLVSEYLARKIILDRELLNKIGDKVIGDAKSLKKLGGKIIAAYKKNYFTNRAASTKISEVSDQCHIIVLLILSTIFQNDDLAKRQDVNTDLLDKIHQLIRQDIGIITPIIPIRYNQEESPIASKAIASNIIDLLAKAKPEESDDLRITEELISNLNLEIQKEKERIKEIEQKLQEQRKAIYTEDEARRLNKEMQEILTKNIEQNILIQIDNQELKQAIIKYLKKPDLESNQHLNQLLIKDCEIDSIELMLEPDLTELPQITKHTIELLRLTIKSLTILNDQAALKIYQYLFKQLPDDNFRKAFFSELGFFEPEIRLSNISYKLKRSLKLPDKSTKISDHASIITELDHYKSDGDRYLTLQQDLDWQEKLLSFTEELSDELQEEITTKLQSHKPLVANKGRILILIPNYQPLLLKQEVSDQILLKLSRSDISRYGTRKVIEITNDDTQSIHLKFNPEFPGIEKSAERLAIRAVGEGIARTQLIRLINDQGQDFAVLASETIGSKNLQERLVLDLELKKDPSRIIERQATLEALKSLNSQNFTRLFIIGLLLTPEDAKPDNFILEAGQLTIIDNDRNFFPSIAIENKKEELQLKNFLFCMDQMQNPLDQEVIEEFLSLDPKEMLRKWAIELKYINRDYKKIFSEAQIVKLYDQEKNVVIPLAYRVGLAQDLLTRIQLIQDLLIRKYDKSDQSTQFAIPNLPATSKKPVTTKKTSSGYSHLDLLVRVEPKAGKIYEDLFTDHPNHPDKSDQQLKRWKIIEHKLYKIIKGVAQSKTPSKMMAKTIAITNKHSLTELLKGGAVTSPEVMADFLLGREIDNDQELEKLKKGQIDDFKEIANDLIKQEIINRIQFASPDITQEIQLEIFKAIEDVVFTELNLKNAKFLTDDLLLLILKKNGQFLRTINISNCINITGEAFINIATYCPNIEEIEMANLPGLVEIRGVKKVANIFGKKEVEAIFPNLRRVNLSGCINLKALNINGVLEDIELGECRSLNFNSSKIGVRKLGIKLYINPKALQETFEKIDKLVNDNTSLTWLDLSSNNIGPEGTKAIAKALENNTSLTSLDLSSNNIGPEGTKALAKALENNTSLTSLILWKNNIGPEGAKALAKALENNTRLTSLYLWKNNIGPEGTKAIAKALENNTRLTSIDLIGNDIGPEGAKAIAKSLEKNTSLTSLNLMRNNIGPEGAKAIAKALENNTSLTSLNLESNDIDDDSKGRIYKLLERNRIIRRDDLVTPMPGSNSPNQTQDLPPPYAPLATFVMPSATTVGSGRIEVPR